MKYHSERDNNIAYEQTQLSPSFRPCNRALSLYLYFMHCLPFMLSVYYFVDHIKFKQSDNCVVDEFRKSLMGKPSESTQNDVRPSMDCNGL